MKYKLAIFDFDGTLADSFPFFLRTVNELAVTHQFRGVNLADVERLRRLNARDILSHMGLPVWKIPVVARGFRTRMAGKSDQIPLFAGVGQMLRGLSDNGVALSLVTSNSHENVRRILHAEYLDLMVHPQCGVSLFGKSAHLRAILRKTGTPRDAAIYIGDELRDLEAARAEDIPFGAVSWGYTHADAFPAHAPAEMFSRMEEIVGKLSHFPREAP
ncbi:MAG: HAD hydrolase-like protein [Blastocatellia bacterium]